MQAAHPIVLTADAATDPTLASCEPATQALFCRALTMMDSNGSLFPDKGLDLIESLHFRLSFKRPIIKKGLRELIGKGMLVPTGNAVFSPKFRELQRIGLDAMLEMTGKASSGNDVARTTDVAQPQVPYQNIDALLARPLVSRPVRTNAPSIETDEERRRRMWREKKRAQRAHADRRRETEQVRDEVSFLETSSGIISDAHVVTSDQLLEPQFPVVSHAKPGDMSPTDGGHVPPSSSSSGSDVSLSNQTQETESTAERSSSESDARGDMSPMDINVSPKISDGMSPSSNRTTGTNDEVGPSLRSLSDRSDKILNEICRASGYKFDCSISHGERVTLVRADTTMEKSFVTRDRWKILAAFLVAGAYSARRGAKPGSLPTIGYFFRHQKDPVEGTVFLDEAFLLTTMRRAIDWDADGRAGPLPDSLPVARGRSPAGASTVRESRPTEARQSLRIGLDDE